MLEKVDNLVEQHIKCAFGIKKTQVIDITTKAYTRYAALTSVNNGQFPTGPY